MINYTNRRVTKIEVRHRQAKHPPSAAPGARRRGRGSRRAGHRHTHHSHTHVHSAVSTPLSLDERHKHVGKNQREVAHASSHNTQHDNSFMAPAARSSYDVHCRLQSVDTGGAHFEDPKIREGTGHSSYEASAGLSMEHGGDAKCAPSKPHR